MSWPSNDTQVSLAGVPDSSRLAACLRGMRLIPCVVKNVLKLQTVCSRRDCPAATFQTCGCVGRVIFVWTA